MLEGIVRSVGRVVDGAMFASVIYGLALGGLDVYVNHKARPIQQIQEIKDILDRERRNLNLGTDIFIMFRGGSETQTKLLGEDRYLITLDLNPVGRDTDLRGELFKIAKGYIEQQERLAIMGLPLKYLRDIPNAQLYAAFDWNP